GVVAIIYEARPNVTVDAAALCIKTGNACILRGGKEAIATNRVLADLMRRALTDCGLPADVLALVDNTTRESSTALMKMRGLVDLLVPRGGAGLIRSVVDNATIPVIETGAGNCHIYIDKSADHALGVKVAINAKMSRPSVCNAIETMLVHEEEAAEFLPKFVAALDGRPLEIRGCEKTCTILGCKAAEDADWATEYDDYILAVKVVADIDEAIAHINRYNTGHSEAIITRDMANAARFRSEIDAAAVYVNTSTRFTDGGEFGFGAELGISTQKLHARGPMGLDALTTGKYLITGDGQVR
ncbi:MAG: glutamate-5-semialdehyde dehydrogenase, partial [Clostridia bacterium]|nr:glutamate-5-semialdehyde dehydrogenase [Clostridia bacterium]